ncbi:MAG TPA: sigma-70 family RNA polymerase sigma factor [Saprospiraceae bacterium]|nr:sigma-70 family RNA polymerase sigma factor [Saprospiraceae bacterium]
MEVTGIPTLPRTARADDDHRLVTTAIGGCQHAYAQLLARYRPAIFQMMLQRVKNAEDAQDLTMEAFEKAFRKLHFYSPTHAFSTWLFKIALNNLIDFTRKKQPLTIHFGDGVALAGFETDWLQNHRSEMPTPEEAMMQEQRIRLIRQLLNRLDERYRRMIELRYYEDMSYEEIAQHLDLPIGTVKAQLYRAKENMYRMLQMPQAQAHLEQTKR